MAYANYAAYKAQYTDPLGVFNWYRVAIGTNSGYPFVSVFAKSSGDSYPTPRGGNSSVTPPTTATACDATTVGGLIKPIAGSGDQLVVAAVIQPKDWGSGLLLMDRLSHQGGLSGTVTTTQTTNLPTAALTRYTSGVGVFAALEVYSTLGATDATWTVVYTNEAGTGSRTVTFILQNTPANVSFIPIPLQGTDSGVRSVESVTLTPSTGTAGNFGVTLFKPLLWLPATLGNIGRPVDIFDLPGWNTPIHDDACLAVIYKWGSVSTNLAQSMALSFGES